MVSGSTTMDRTLTIISCLLLLLAAFFVVVGFACRLVFAQGPLAQAKIVQIAVGQGVQAIAKQLQNENVISSDLLFIAASVVSGDRAKLKAGEYEFVAGQSLAATMSKIARGDVYIRKLTIPEGWTSYQVVEALNRVEGLLGAIDVVPAEGTLLPETYLFQRGEKRAEVLARMQKAMSDVVENLWNTRQANLPINTKEQALVLASIIEKETGVAAERARVAGVFTNRLRLGMKLQSDPTVIYAITEGKAPLGRPLYTKDLENVNSPYNTYMYEGLPIGPIANPGRKAIAAALNPDASDELYFVADGTGGHVFAQTLEQHNTNVAKWRALQAQKP